MLSFLIKLVRRTFNDPVLFIIATTHRWIETLNCFECNVNQLHVQARSCWILVWIRTAFHRHSEKSRCSQLERETFGWLSVKALDHSCVKACSEWALFSSNAFSRFLLYLFLFYKGRNKNKNIHRSSLYSILRGLRKWTP